ncbi:MAG: hypothetical protein PHS14_01220 [Elusimicrobia bacterium]|nr:hypothetical protein [Elusimicrobiota bacterium]
MNALPLLAAALLAAFAALPLQAQNIDPKDGKKAAKLAEKDSDFRSLPDDEKQAVILFIAEQIHGRRRRAISADIRTLTGRDVGALKKRAAAREIVLAEQDKDPVSIPGTSKLEIRPIETPDFGRLFGDNEWTVLENSAEAQTLKQNIDKVVDLLKKNDGRLVSMHVESSASTLRNTGKAANLTHLELSKLRAEAAARYALDYLKMKGFPLDEDEQVTLDYKGTNGNGTSGPSSPFAVPADADPKLVAAGSCEAPPELKAAAAKGTAMTTDDWSEIASFYNPNKFVHFTFDALFEVNNAKPGVNTPGEAHMVTADVDYRKKLKIRLPHLEIHLPRISFKWLANLFDSDKRRARHAVRCPTFKKR